MALKSPTSILAADVNVNSGSTTEITVGSAELNGNSHFIILHIEAFDTNGGVHFIDPVRNPLQWRNADDEWAKRLSRHMLFLPSAYHVPVLDTELHPSGELFGLRDLADAPGVNFASARLTLLTFN